MNELPRAACEALLARNTIGRLGCYSPEHHQVYVVPITYDFHDGAIFFSSIDGEKVEFLRAHPQGICLEVDEIDDTLNWSSVIVRGDYDELESTERASEKAAALQRAATGPLHWIFDPDVSERARDQLVIAAIRIRDMSGRRERWSPGRPPSMPLSFLPSR